MRPSSQASFTRCCAVSRQKLAERAAVGEEAERREQLRFERICARELLGETD